MVTLGQALEARRKIRPASNVLVLYHDMEDDPTDDDAAHQKLKVKHAMIWKSEEGAPVKQEEGATHTTMDYRHLAGAVPVHLRDNPTTCCVWTMRWTLGGLAPVRPSVALVQAVSVPAGKALPLNM